MTTTIPPLSEALRNAVLAALDERIARLERQVRIEQAWADNVVTPSEDAQRALVWGIAALHESKLARELIGEAEATPPEQSDPVTAALAYHDRMAEAFGR